MKIAIFADVHSNFEALISVIKDINQWRPDLVLVGGDIINRGPQPFECTELVLERAVRDDWRVICGNHERFVLECGRGNLPTVGPAHEISRHAKWTYAKVAGLTDNLAELPVHWDMVDEYGHELRMVHASMLGDRKGIFQDDTDEKLLKKIAPAPRVIIVGHTHRPFIRTIDNTLVVNVGAVGAPFDHDPRAGYAKLILSSGYWKAEIIRLEYDRQKAITRFIDTGYLEESGDFARLIMAEFYESRSLIPGWYKVYEKKVMEGEITLKASVDRYLASCNISI